VYPRTEDPGRRGCRDRADGLSEAEILAAYPDLEAEDVREALRFAAENVRNVSYPAHELLSPRRMR
jgi:hypothetical protein